MVYGKKIFSHCEYPQISGKPAGSDVLRYPEYFAVWRDCLISMILSSPIHLQHISLSESLGIIELAKKIGSDKILENNIQKLQARFPDKFSTNNALNRDLVKERNILES